MEICRRYSISCAHSLPKTPPEHKCHRLHGHTYEIYLYVKADILIEPMDWVMDFSEIDDRFKRLRKLLDHSELNDIIANPTCENLALYIWRNLKPELSDLYKITIREGRDSWVTYEG